MRIFVNGKLVPAEEAVIHVEDAGLQHAVGLFETMLARHGRVFRLRQHLERLAKSAVELGLVRRLEIEPLAQVVNQTVAANDLKEARVRLTLTAGRVSMLRPAGAPEPMPSLIVVAVPPLVYDPKYFEEGVMVLIGPAGANPFDALAGHKTLSYWGRLRTLRQAASVGAQEVIWLNVSNHLASGAVSNVFVVKNGKLLTPFARGEEVSGALPAPVLPGITRAAIIELAQQKGIEVERRMLSVWDLLEADEVFLTNSSWQVLPVVAVERKEIGGGKVGPMTRDLRQALLELIEKETQSEAEASGGAVSDQGEGAGEAKKD